MKDEVKFKDCRECKIETPHKRVKVTIYGIVYECRVCGKQWLYDGLTIYEYRKGKLVLWQG